MAEAGGMRAIGSQAPGRHRPVPRLAATAATSAPLEVTLDVAIVGSLPGSSGIVGNSLRVIAPLSFIEKDDSVAKDDVAAGRKE